MIYDDENTALQTVEQFGFPLLPLKAIRLHGMEAMLLPNRAHGSNRITKLESPTPCVGYDLDLSKLNLGEAHR